MVEINIEWGKERNITYHSSLDDIMKRFKVGIFWVITHDDNPSNLVKFLEAYRKNNE